MKNIGIVTYVRTDNYGAELQGYALRKKLDLLGFSAEVLNIDKVEIDAKTFREMARGAILKRLRKNPIGGILSIAQIAFRILFRTKRGKSATEIARQKSREDAFLEFWKNEIIHTEYIPLDKLSESAGKYDILIAGSDQIWNYTRTSYLDPYFLTFAANGTKKLSYAASFSVSSIPPNRQDQYRALINNVDHISVRETDGLNIIKKLTGRFAELVVDPTLLLQKEEWLKVSSDRIKIDRSYILTYSLNSSTGYWKIVKQYAKKYNLAIVNLRHDFDDRKLIDNQIDIFDAGPREFLYLLANAKMVITNSFHGTIFSINFGVPFLSVISRISGTNSRIHSILAKLDLSSCLMYDDEMDLERPIEIDFTHSHKILEKEINKSLDFLIRHIN